jgi:hypothetical protein
MTGENACLTLRLRLHGAGVDSSPYRQSVNGSGGG